MKKIIYSVLIILIIGLMFWYNPRNNNNDYIEIENIVVKETKINDEIKTIKVHITGAVANPSVIEVEEGSRIIDIVKLAGGLLEYADTAKVNLAYKVNDGEKINIPSIYDKEEIDVVTRRSRTRRSWKW